MLTILRCLLVAGLGATFLSASAQQRQGKKYALLVGVNQYDPNELRDLKYSDKDVTVLAEVLKEAGFRRVVLMTQSVGARNNRFLPMADKIRDELKGLLEDRREEDLVVVVLAGHGIELRDSNDPLFCPMDAKPSKKQNMISYKELYASLARSRAGVKLLLVDACRNEPRSDFSKARAEVDLESATRPQLQKPPRGVAALFSCSAGQKAYESPKLEHGIFLHFVIKGLKGEASSSKTNTVTIDSLMRYVKAEVVDQSVEEFGREFRQQPALNVSLEGDPELITGLKPLPATVTGRKPLPPTDVVKRPKDPEVLFLQGEFKSAREALSATIKFHLNGASIRGEAKFRNAVGMAMQLEIVGALDGKNLTAKTYFEGEYWSDWQCTLDVGGGTLTGRYYPVSPRATRGVGTISFAKP